MHASRIATAVGRPQLAKTRSRAGGHRLAGSHSRIDLASQIVSGRRVFARPTTVPDQQSHWAQLYHAKVYPSDAAWQKAVRYPDADPFVQQLAERGLVRYYLVVTEDHRAALRELRRLEVRSQAEDPTGLMHAFSLAGLCISSEKLGDEDEARTIQAKLDAGMRDELREAEPQIYRLFETSLERLGVS